MPPCPHHCPPDSPGPGPAVLMIAGGAVLLAGGGAAINAAAPALTTLAWLILAGLLIVCVTGVTVLVLVLRHGPADRIGPAPSPPRVRARVVGETGQRPPAPALSEPVRPRPALPGQRPGSPEPGRVVIPGRVLR